VDKLSRSAAVWIAWTVTLAGVSPRQAAGQTEPTESRVSDLRPLTLDELLRLATVTGSGGELVERATTPANVVFISRAEIIQNGWQSLGEALVSVPGLYLIDSGTSPSIGVRGVTGGLRAGTRLVKVMINGVAVNFRPDLRAFLGPEYLPMDAIERIEIAMGPLSALYGANAFIATVNVITRSPVFDTVVETSGAGQYLDQGRLGWRTSGMASYGTADVTVLLAATTASLDRSGRRVQRTFTAQDPAEGRFSPYFSEPSRADYASPTSAFGQLKVMRTPLGTFSLEGGVQSLRASGEFELNSTLTHESRESLTNGWVSTKLDKTWSEGNNTTLRLGFSGGAPNQDEQFYLTGSRARAFKRNFGYKSVEASFTSLFSAGSRFSLRFGLDGELDRENVLYYTAIFNQAEGLRQAGARLDLIADDQPRRQLLSNVGGDLQLSVVPFSLLPTLRLTASGRLDRVSYGSFGPPLQPSYRFAITYNAGQKLFLKAIVGKAFQAPSGVLMFAQPGFGAANNIIGNLNAPGVPALRPQTIQSGELVIHGLIASRAVLEASFFYQQLRDKIEFRSGGTDHVARNGGQTTYAGAEATAHFDFGPWRPFLSGATVAVVNGRRVVLAAPEAYPGMVGTAGFDLDLFHERLHLTARVRRVGERGATPSNVFFNQDARYSLPAFTAVDVTLTTARLYPLGENAETRLTISAADLLNRARSEPAFGGYDLPVTGRRILVGLRQSF
jgi:outer membrane receptor protein involved in Fe transport